MIAANIFYESFIKGGWVMWPIIFAMLASLCVIVDRAVWWLLFRRTCDSARLQQASDALATGNFTELLKLLEATKDPYLRNLAVGVAQARSSLSAAMLLDASHVIERSEARLWALSTMITLAPLLGLFGTVVGIMESFAFVGSDSLAVTKVSGGIAEALIATASGIAIAILCLLPYNYFRKLSSQLRARLERWINQAELWIISAKEHGNNLEKYLEKSTNKTIH